MALFAQLVRPGDTVFDVGGHIGYVALYLSLLATDRGQVSCFEPSPPNLRYLEVNVRTCPRRNIAIIRSTVGDHPGEVPFFVESLTGQNCTTVPQLDLLDANNSVNGLRFEYEQCSVPMITADSLGQRPHFVKIDVESGELPVLIGMRDTDSGCPPPNNDRDVQRFRRASLSRGRRVRAACSSRVQRFRDSPRR